MILIKVNKESVFSRANKRLIPIKLMFSDIKQ